MKTPGILAISLMMLLFSCRKDSFITSGDARVTITADTLKYDTVFVTSGSTYRTFKVINENNQKLRLSSLKLMGGAGSVFKMNVDGIPGTQFSNIEIEPNDSLYVFAQVNINPAAANLPFVLRDSIEISYNGKKRLVQLEAWGQNAHFFRNKVVAINETWNNDLPYVILGSLLINQTLTINKGCRIYVHADAPVVVNGTLVINGLKDSVDRVYFQGDRLDEPYKDYPASWPGIFFQPSSKDNVFNFAIIKNAYQAIGLQDLPPLPSINPKLTLNECVIDNAYDAGIISINSSIRARNCLISNCGKNLFLAKGGDYQFTHCTIVTYANRYIDHKDPVLTLTDNDKITTKPILATFRNCIFWGENGLVDNEVLVDIKGSIFTINFNSILWKVNTPPSFINSSGIINNLSPKFDSINTFRNYYNFRLQKGNPISPAVDAGSNFGVLNDLDAKLRPIGSRPDLGCYERQ